MKSRTLQIMSLMGALCLSACGVFADERPNIILIYVDDMGYVDAGCYGGTNLVPIRPAALK